MNTTVQCAEHPYEKIAGSCIRCKRPVCVKCMELRGYFCTDACKVDHLASKPIGDQEGSELAKEREERQERRTDLLAVWLLRRVPLIVLAFILLCLGLYFLDKSGTERWSVLPPESAIFVDVVPSGDSVFALRNDGLCLALSADSGVERWKNEPAVERSNAESMEPDSGRYFSFFGARLDVAGGLVIRRGFDALSALPADTGKTLWQRDLDSFDRIPTVYAGGRVLLVDRLVEGGGANAGARSMLPDLGFLSGNSFSVSPSLICVDAKSGNELWHRTFDHREVRTIGATGDICYCVTCLPPRIEWTPCEKHSTTNAVEMAACTNCGHRFARASSFEMNLIRAADGSPLWTGRMTSGLVDEVRLCGDRIAILAGTHLYVLSLDGKKKAHARLPSDTRKICLGNDYAAAATKSGRIVVISTRDGTTAWERKIGGQAWDLDIAAESLYVTAGLPGPNKDRMPDGTPKSPVPRSAQEQMLQEVQGQYNSYGNEDDLLSRPECRSLINYRLADGKERWRRQPVVGQLHVLPDGNCLLLSQGGEVAALFLSGTGSYVTEHLQRSGKEIWSFKVQEATLALRTDADSVYLLTGEGRGLFGKWSDAEVRDGTIRAIRRRTIINRVRKL